MSQVICPIRKLTQLIYDLRPAGLIDNNIEKVDSDTCIKSQCAWYSKYHKACSVSLIGKTTELKLLND